MYRIAIVEDDKSFIEELKKKTTIKIVTQDERFTTLEARRLLLEADVKRVDRKAVIDKIAASYILETYMNTIKNKEKQNG